MEILTSIVLLKVHIYYQELTFEGYIIILGLGPHTVFRKLKNIVISNESTIEWLHLCT